MLASHFVADLTARGTLRLMRRGNRETLPLRHRQKGRNPSSYRRGLIACAHACTAWPEHGSWRRLRWRSSASRRRGSQNVTSQTGTSGRSAASSSRSSAPRALKKYWDQIKNYFRHRITNVGAEGINGRIQRTKGRACGFWSCERFRMAIYFDCRGLDLNPSSLTSGQCNHPHESRKRHKRQAGCRRSSNRLGWAD